MSLLSKWLNFLWNILFPPYCIQCGAEGNYLCPDCSSMIEILEWQYCPFCPQPKMVQDGKTCQRCRKKYNLDGLFCATSYENKLVKKIITYWKYEPYLARCLSDTLTSFIITHLQLINKIHLSTEKETIWIPVPLDKKRLKWRGFHHTQELTEKLANSLGGKVFLNILVKNKNTMPQAELSKEERIQNIKGAFSCLNPELIAHKKILLVDDIFTTGATMEECAKTLKKAGAKEVWGVVIARG